MNKKIFLVIVICIALVIIGCLLNNVFNKQEKDEQGEDTQGNVEINEKLNYYLKNPKEIYELKTTLALNSSIQIYENRYNNTNIPNSPIKYDYTIKEGNFNIDKVLINCELMEENNIQYIKLPYWFRNCFEISEKLQLDKKYNLNNKDCILELNNIDVERYNEYDIWKIETYNIYEKEEIQIDYEAKCIGEYFEKEVRTDSVPNVN